MTILFAACATGPARLDVDQHLQDQLRRVDNWRAEGKLGVRVDGDAHSANFDWQHQSGDYSLRLSGPFGQGTTWLRRTGRQVTLESPDAPLRQATSAEQLMQAQLGWQVPVSNLRYWIKGIAAPDLPVDHLERNADGTLATLSQQGWEISYPRYQAHNGWALPNKLIARRGDLQLTLIIKSWDLSLPEPQAARQ